MDKQNIAVIGTGVAGLTAAYLLQQQHQVALFERNDYIGGHTHTVVVPDGPDAGTPIDTGFIVLNNKNYPLFHLLLHRLGCATRWSNMSFGFYSKATGLQYAGTGINGLFADRSNLLRMEFYMLFTEITRFCRTARRDLAEGLIEGRTLRSYLSFRDISNAAINNYIIPMASAIWSAPHAQLFEFPAQTLIQFWNNHGLLSLDDRPRWQTVAGGSQSYVKAILKDFSGTVEANARIEHVRRTDAGAVVRMQDGRERKFDRVVLAAHADESLKLLADPSDAEKKLLGQWRYANNLTVLHTDTSFLPPSRRAWASWNYTEEAEPRDDQPASVTYWMNLLQGLRAKRNYCVTLNPAREIAPEKVVARLAYTHPQFSFDATRSQDDLPDLNGQRNTYFCGSYFGYGFHEDAVRSGVAVAKCFGLDL